MVEATLIHAFLKKHYKQDRFKNENGFNSDREQRKVKDVITDFKIYKESTITFHSSSTDETITFNENLKITKRGKGRVFNLTSLF